MSLSTVIIGVGAAGNKAAIQVLKDNIMDKSQILLLNSTIRDVPEDYKDLCIEFGDIKGCGKERELAKKMIMSSMQNNQVNLDEFLKRSKSKIVTIVSSSEGGTGSGASVLIAQYIDYINNQMKKKNPNYKPYKIHMVVFTGFEDDARGLKNTVDWFNDLNSTYTVEAISNQNFMNEAKSREEAEDMANKEFAKRMSIYVGNYIVPSDDNMDDTDLYKTVTTPGYLMIEHTNIEKLKSKEDFDNLLEEMIENSRSLDTEVGSTRIGVIINTTQKNRSYMDETFKLIKEKYGTPYEFYKHFQTTDSDEFVQIIISGAKLPIDTIKKTYDKYTKQMEAIDFKKDDFFNSKDKFDTSIGNSLDFDLGAGEFMSEESQKDLEDAKDNFFSTFAPSTQTNSFASGFSNTIKNKKLSVTKNEL